jgi:hypothetical protein
MTGKEVLRFDGHPGGTSSLAFTPDGRELASGGGDGSILIWDITGNWKRPANSVTEKELDNHWTDLASADAAKAHRAIWQLADHARQALPFLRKRLRAVAPADAVQIRKLIVDLSSARFAVREKAYKELEKQVDLAAPALREAATGNAPLETRRRVDQLLGQLRRPIAAARDLQAIRAAAVLESIASVEARDCLQFLAEGAAEARLTHEAKAALQRLGRW